MHQRFVDGPGMDPPDFKARSSFGDPAGVGVELNDPSRKSRIAAPFTVRADAS